MRAAGCLSRMGRMICQGTPGSEPLAATHGYAAARPSEPSLALEDDEENQGEDDDDQS
jgi:hypothetical protein